MIKEKLIKIECNENGEAVITSLLEPDLSVFSKEELEILKASKEKLLDKSGEEIDKIIADETSAYILKKEENKNDVKLIDMHEV